MFSFASRKKTVDLSPYVRRICDLTTPNMTSSPELVRVENRYNRAIPTLIVPCVGGQPLLDNYVIGITKDIADHGIGLILTEPFNAEQVLLGFWIDRQKMSEPWFFYATARRCAAVGGGYWTLGVELDEFANLNLGRSAESLVSLAEELLVRDAAASSAD